MAHVETVLGRVDPAELGFTLPHEHTQIALWHVRDRWDYWELTRDRPLILDELGALRAAGGGTLVDLTPPGVGRDPEWLVGLAETSGLNIVMGCGWYREAYYPPDLLVDRRSVDSLADQIVAEFEDGLPAGDGGRRVRPGIIGEIGTDKPWVTAQEERVFRACARAARRTGLAITTHAVMSPVGRAQLQILIEEGVDPARVVIGHADSYPDLDHYLDIVGTGASVEFDFLGMSFTPQERLGEGRIVDLLRELLARGHAERILLSQDVCHNSQLRHYGGNGYTYLLDAFLPRLREAGVAEDEITTITVRNPARLLTIA
jgi:predicted metal-dependent phosphotriesterase family hydrolase